MKRSQRARNPDNYRRARPPHGIAPFGNGELIENPDSWRKVRRTAAIVYREDVRLPKRICAGPGSGPTRNTAALCKRAAGARVVRAKWLGVRGRPSGVAQIFPITPFAVSSNFF